jgi:hypothetical protein
MIPAEAKTPNDLAALFAAVEKISHRLDKLEAAANPYANHPSLDKLNIVEAIADSVFKEKACQFEPDKPCDHCSMCNSRGF